MTKLHDQINALIENFPTAEGINELSEDDALAIERLVVQLWRKRYAEPHPVQPKIDLISIRQPETGEILYVYAIGHIDKMAFFLDFLEKYPDTVTEYACLANVQHSSLPDRCPITRIALV